MSTDAAENCRREKRWREVLFIPCDKETILLRLVNWRILQIGVSRWRIQVSRRSCDCLNTAANAWVGTYLIKDQQHNRDPELEYKLLITNVHTLINAPSSGTLAALPGNYSAPIISVPVLKTLRWKIVWWRFTPKQFSLSEKVYETLIQRFCKKNNPTALSVQWLGYWLDGPRFDSRKKKKRFFCSEKRPDRSCCLLRFLFNGYRCSFPWIKAADDKSMRYFIFSIKVFHIRLKFISVYQFTLIRQLLQVYVCKASCQPTVVTFFCDPLLRLWQIILFSARRLFTSPFSHLIFILLTFCTFWHSKFFFFCIHPFLIL